MCSYSKNLVEKAEMKQVSSYHDSDELGMGLLGRIIREVELTAVVKDGGHNRV